MVQKINSRIVLKITTLVIIEIILIVGSFGVLSYFQSLQSSLGNSINIAGKNRYLSANLLLQIEWYLDGSSDISHIIVAMNSLQSNIISLKQGGSISRYLSYLACSNIVRLITIDHHTFTHIIMQIRRCLIWKYETGVPQTLLSYFQYDIQQESAWTLADGFRLGTVKMEYHVADMPFQRMAKRVDEFLQCRRISKNQQVHLWGDKYKPKKSVFFKSWVLNSNAYTAKNRLTLAG